ncbi:MAG: septum formation initiator family protein [Oscillospiraceae bacterium]|nr:septum formation initiator family protein [Oscillospiraceae bacterium]
MSDVSLRQRKRSAARTMRDYRKKKRGRTSPLLVLIVTVAVSGLILSCGVAFIYDEVTVAKKQAELAELNAKIDELKAENMSYESILNDEDERSFMERIATERLGYAYPNERRFVDPNKNNG